MGREWYLNWGTKPSKKRTTGGRGGGPANQTATVAAAAAAATSGGCMNAVLHLFDLNHFQLCLQPHDNAAVKPTSSTSFLTNDSTSLKGVEAPRNSLESLEEMEIGPPTLASIIEDEKDCTSHVPASRRDTKLKLVQAPRGKIEDMSSESSCSPGGARTPNLVARLMGLDILPDSNTTTPRSSICQPIRSPRVASSTPPSKSRKSRTRSSYDNNVGGPHSVPETPTPSSSSMRRKSMDVIEQHRLSLQINKENSIVKEMESSRPSCSAISTKRKEGRSYEEECRSPGYYARQIMKQVRETVGRRVGVDITNTVGQKDREHRRDEHLLSINKHKKSSLAKKELSPGKNVTHSPSLRSKVSFNLENQSISEPAIPKAMEDQASMASNLQSKPIEKEEEEKQKSKQQHCSKKLGLEQNLRKLGANNKSCLMKPPLRSLDSIRNKKDEQFVRPPTNKKCKKTPLSNDFLHGSVPSLVPLKKDSPSTTTKLLNKQETLPKVQPLKGSTRIPSHRCERVQEEAMHTPAQQGERRRSKDSSSLEEFQYIMRLLKFTGIDRDTPVSFTRWFSPSHPLDPSIFHNLEAAHYLTSSSTSSPRHQVLGLAINRKLVFHLVDEILADILKPYIRFKPWVFTSLGQNSNYHHQQHHQQKNGFQLAKTLCTRIRSFPSADCQSLQDIDALVEKDLPKSGAQSNLEVFEEEGEAIVLEIEGDIVDSLVQEMASLCVGSSMQRWVTNGGVGLIMTM